MKRNQDEILRAFEAYIEIGYELYDRFNSRCNYDFWDEVAEVLQRVRFREVVHERQING